ncbi:MAG: chorismate-binding protein, partial [Haloarculaceae archaeon]
MAVSPDLDPDRETFASLAAGERPAVVRAAVELDVDVEPLEAYAALTGRTADHDGGDYAFLLESAEKVASSDPDGAFAPTGRDRHARYSFVGYDPRAVVTVGGEASGGADGDVTASSDASRSAVDVEVFDDRYADLVTPDGGDVLDSLRASLPDADPRGFPDDDRQHLDGGLVGFLAYDAVYDLWLDEVGRQRPASRFPDAQFVLTTTTLVFDDADGSVRLVFTPVLTDDEDAEACYDRLEAEADRVGTLLSGATALETGGFHQQRERAGPREDYEAAVERAKEHVLDGDIYQGVVSRKRELYGDVDPLGFYESLRSVNPSPYMYLLGYDDLTIVGASPETLVSVRGREVMSNPIAGTCDRGTSPVEDRRLAGEMLADGKERAEHTMLVDLARNDVRRVARAGSVRVEEFMNVLKYSHVQHI